MDRNIVATIGPSPAPNRTDGPKVESSVTEKQQNILRSDTKLTPWTSIGEFNSIGRGLLLATSLFPPPASVSDDRCCPLPPEERSQLEYAIHVAAVWRDRAEGGRLPHAVETSAALAAALLEDAIAHDYTGGPRPSELSLRLSYSSAVVRATNGLADASIANRASKRPGYGVSVAALCERLGIPGWIVDMRHDAAHNELPSLPSLRLAAKTLLAYLGDQYWAEMSRLRGYAMTKALGILDTYKASAKAVAVEESARVAAQISKAEARKAGKKGQREKNKKNDKENDDGEQSGDDELWGFGRYSIFADIKKTKSKKRGREESASEPDATNESTVTKKQKKEKLPSPLQLANKYIDEVPIDIGLQILLSHLVWGGVSDMPPEKGALVPGSPATIPETPQGFDKVKSRYSLLIAVVASAYTGFLQALIVNLVDIVIMLEERIPDGAVHMDAGDERKVFFLSSWIRYLLSREFQLHFDPFIGIYPNGNIDLTRKKYWKWTDAEKEYMSDCAQLEALQRWHFPLNSLFDRCDDSPARNTNRKVAELAALFARAAGEAFAKGMGIVSTFQRIEKEKTVEKACNGGEKQPLTSAPMSLEQMEALLSDSDADDEKVGGSIPTDDTETQSKVKTKESLAGGAAASATLTEDTADSTSADQAQSSWVICKSWDSCAIGTLPGYPSY